VQIACDTAARGAARLAEIEMPSFPDTEQTFAELIARCQKAIDHVNAVDDAKIDATALDQQPPRFRYTTLGGRLLDLTWLPHRQPYAGQAKIDDQAVDYASWPLHGNPWVRQKTGEPILHLQHGKDRLSYDFIRWTRRAWQAESR
jgi:hypothetical protein